MLTAMLGFFGGLGIFLYGTNVLSSSLQKIGASKMRSYLATITNTKLKAVLSGIVVTFFLQSSTVTNIIIVGLVGSAIITLSQAFGIVLGAAVGTTITVQILTFDIAQYSSIFIFFGVIFTLFIKKTFWNNMGSILLSIGFIFFGIGLITASLEPLSENPDVLTLLLKISEMPLLFIIISMLLTALMHSSAAVIIIGIAFISSGVLTLSSVIPLVLGANIGATIPVVISSLTSSVDGKKLGVFYFTFKSLGVLIALPFVYLFMDYIAMLPGSAERQIAHFHTLFNIAIVVIFYPFLGLISTLFERFFVTKQKEATFSVNIDDSLLDVPDEALISSKKQIVRLGEMVQTDMIKQLRNYTSGTTTAEAIQASEVIVDESYIELQQFLLKLGQRDLTNYQSTQEVKLLNILNDIENIGDTIIIFMEESNLAEEKNVTLSESDKKELNKLLYYIEMSYANALISFKNNDLELAKENIQLQSTINQFEKDIKFNHFSNLINAQTYNPNISAVYLDTVNQLFQIYHHCMNISRTVLGII